MFAAQTVTIGQRALLAQARFEPVFPGGVQGVFRLHQISSGNVGKYQTKRWVGRFRQQHPGLSEGSLGGFNVMGIQLKVAIDDQEFGSQSCIVWRSFQRGGNCETSGLPVGARLAGLPVAGNDALGVRSSVTQGSRQALRGSGRSRRWLRIASSRWFGLGCQRRWLFGLCLRRSRSGGRSGIGRRGRGKGHLWLLRLIQNSSPEHQAENRHRQQGGLAGSREPCGPRYLRRSAQIRVEERPVRSAAGGGFFGQCEGAASRIGVLCQQRRLAAGAPLFQGLFEGRGTGKTARDIGVESARQNIAQSVRQLRKVTAAGGVIAYLDFRAALKCQLQ